MGNKVGEIVKSPIHLGYSETANLEEKSTDELTAEAKNLYQQAETIATISIMMVAAAGERLKIIKKRIGHGNWLPYVKENLPFSESKAAKMMRLADEVEEGGFIFRNQEALANIGISKVWALLEAPEEVASEVIETHDVADMAVRELRKELARAKAEKQTEIDALKEENDSLKDRLSETFTDDQVADIEEKYQTEIEELNKKMADANDIQAKLDKAKEDLRKAKQKLKDAEAAKDEEVQKRLEEASIELTNKAKEEAFAESEAEIKKHLENIEALEAQVKKLEADKDKLSNPALQEFQILARQLQSTYNEIMKLIDKQDDELAQKMYRALARFTDGWGA